jgi:superfamily I DNA/RNA helicase
MTDHPLTHEQEAVVEAAATTSDNLIVKSLAGTGKSHTLRLTERAVDRQPIMYLVFNTNNALKIMSLEQMATERRQIKDGHSEDPDDRCLSTTTVRTLNSCGHRIWAQSQSKNLRVDGEKSRTILKGIIDSAPKDHRDAIWSVFTEVTSAVSLAKALGYVPEGAYPNAKRLITQTQFHHHLDEVPDDLTVDLIDAVLLRSIKQSYDGLVDFDDQVYMPALFGGAFPQFPLVLVDEAQDLSPVNYMLLERLAKGRLIGVGDPWQNIYGFRGAKAGGMEAAAAKWKCTTLNLSISFRCPSAIVKNVHWRVPHFQWSTEGGSVEKPDKLEVGNIPDEATIICRNNAPLFAFAMRLLSSGRSISIAGSDIGPRLIKIMGKFGPESLNRNGTLAAIENWLEHKREKESKSAEDIAECMRVFANQGKTLGQAIGYAEHLFKQTGKIYLTTGHKAKGLEWDTVVHLDPWLVRKNQTDQEMNLDYVISTRSRDRLIEIESEQVEW